MEFRDALAAYAAWIGLGHGDRAERWVKRLELNRPELEAFRDAPDCEEPAYQPSPALVANAGGFSLKSDLLPSDAREALRRAHEVRELNAFTWLPDSVESGARGFLSGVPIAVKDLMRVAGAPLTGGSRALGSVVQDRDAEVVARLRRAGAVVTGLTNLHELAYGITSDNPHFGRVVNPAARDRIPGGSSGGSAAAIAAGVVRAALGTDTAGSIRIPAACCGIVGFKPSYDALPREGVIDLAATLDHVGPMGRDVEDCAALFAAMLGLASVPDWTHRDLGGRRVGRLGGWFASPLDDEVRAAVDAAAHALEQDGARIVEREVDGMALAPAIQFNTIVPEATAVHSERVRHRPEGFGEEVRVRLEIGHFLPGVWYVKAQRWRTRLVHAIEAAFTDASVLLCATLRTPAPPVGATNVTIGERVYPLHTAVTQLTFPFNLAGLPAVSVPWTKSRDGVPIAVQVIAPRGQDWRALAFAERLQARAPWRAGGSGTR